MKMKNMKLGLALIALAPFALSSAAHAARETNDPNRQAETAAPLSAAKLFELYGNKSWNWRDGARYFATKDHRFTAHSGKGENGSTMVASAIGASARTAMPADTKTATADPSTLPPTAPTDKSPWANFELGRNFALGTGVAKDVQKARTYYEQALTSADPAVAKASAFALGQLAEKELKDPATASGYFQKGADLGGEWSILSLAKL